MAADPREELARYNRAMMPETAKDFAMLKELFAELGPISLVYAKEGDYEIGTRLDVVEEGRTWIEPSEPAFRSTTDRNKKLKSRRIRHSDEGSSLIVQKVRPVIIGPRARKITPSPPLSGGPGEDD
jgi:hypothetical protein